MDISSLNSLAPDYIAQAYGLNRTQSSSGGKDDSFGAILDTALGMLRETNDYSNAAEAAQIQFALGEANSTHELAAAQQKANLALQYTVAVRDKVMEAYREIMNMSV